jgi:hypothetical protein
MDGRIKKGKKERKKEEKKRTPHVNGKSVLQ